MPSINYPTWTVRQRPTPAETLYVCDKCGEAHWSIAGIVPVCHRSECKGRKGGPPRMRPATKAETAEGKRHLKEIIGTDDPPLPTTRHAPAKLPAGVKPLFVLKFLDSYPGLYYCDTVAFNGVQRDAATKMSHKRVHAAQAHLKRVGCLTEIEPA